MAKLSLLAGTTSKTVKIFIQDSSVTTGAGLTGLTSGSSGLTAYYIREGANATVSVTLAAGTLGTYTNQGGAGTGGGFIVVDGTNMPGLYEFSIPNAAIASGAKSVVIYLRGATNMAQTLLEIELTAVDNQDSVRYGMSALPNASAGASTGLIINGTNAGALTESYSALHAAPTFNQILYEIRSLLAENSVASTTVTTRQVDGSTTAETFTINSATTPTSITRAS